MARKTRPTRLLVRKKIEEALAVLQSLGLPREQQNERSALTLLSLLDLKPETPWAQASNPLQGITPMMTYFSAHFGKKYAPNSRETVRRFTVHQFEQAGIVIKNPDKPRAINSPDNVYQIEASTLELLKTFGAEDWGTNLSAYFLTRETLREKYAAERVMHNIPITLRGGRQIELSPGGQNILIKQIIESFCPRYVAEGELLYVGDAGSKFAVWEKATFASLGLAIDEHGKMPDVVVHDRGRRWLLLIEAVTSHGPVNPKRHRELKDLFSPATVGLVFVTAFLDRKTLTKYVSDIAWETEVWVADAPSHLIHFNGIRFLGPYEGGTDTPTLPG
jgi:hypothetical protein